MFTLLNMAVGKLVVLNLILTSHVNEGLQRPTVVPQHNKNDSVLPTVENDVDIGLLTTVWEGNFILDNSLQKINVVEADAIRNMLQSFLDPLGFGQRGFAFRILYVDCMQQMLMLSNTNPDLPRKPNAKKISFSRITRCRGGSQKELCSPKDISQNVQQHLNVLQNLTEEFIDSKRYNLLRVFIMKCIINPTIGFFGLALNSFSIAVVKSSDTESTTRLLLISLLVAGILQQISALNFPEIFEIISRTQRNHYVIIFKELFNMPGVLGYNVFTQMHMLIIVDRLFAVFAPAHYKIIITKKVASLSVVTLYTLWLPFIIYTSTARYLFSTDNFENLKDYKTRMKVLTNILYYQRLSQLIALIVGKCIPLSVVIFGGLAIFIRLKLVSGKRLRVATVDLDKDVNPVNVSTKSSLLTCLALATLESLCLVWTLVAFSKVCPAFTNIVAGSGLETCPYLITASCTIIIFNLTNKTLRQQFTLEMTKLKKRMNQ